MFPYLLLGPLQGTDFHLLGHREQVAHIWGQRLGQGGRRVEMTDGMARLELGVQKSNLEPVDYYHLKSIL